MSELAERIERVRARLADAAARAGRPVESVRLLAVSKTHPPAAVREAAACGLTDFGENKVQEAALKIPLAPGRLTWHLVGHLQSNKVRAAVRLFDYIHSVDSARLLRLVEEESRAQGRRPKVFLEVNVAGEASKFGLAPEAVGETLAAAQECRAAEVVGLMAIPPVVAEPERARGFFRRLRELRDELRGATGFALDELSMGMSHDAEIAVEEGATWVRIGTDIFGPRAAAWKPTADELGG